MSAEVDVNESLCGHRSFEFCVSLSQNFFFETEKREEREEMLIRKNDYIEQIKSSERERKKESAVFDRPFCPPFISGDLRRVVFCSLSLLEREFKKIPSNVLKNAVLCLDADRSWAFHPFSEGKGSERQISFLKSQFDSRYFDFEADFLAFLREKEETGLCYWHRPNRNYKDMSTFFESIKDPVEEKDVFYNPLILDQEVRSFTPYDLTHDPPNEKRRHGKRITEHYRRGGKKRRERKRR